MILLQSLYVLGLISCIQGRTFDISWSLQGVENYTSNPLKTELGDNLRLTCNKTSNLFIQTDLSQYVNCNASAGSGLSVFNGFCFAGGEIFLTLTENSQSLMNTVNFQNNNFYYFTSYSNGNIGDVSKSSIDHGGQCTEGLKMVVLIGEDASSPVTEGNKPANEDDNIDLIIIIVASAIAGLIVIGSAVVIICCCYWYFCAKSKTKVDQERDSAKITHSGASVCKEVHLKGYVSTEKKLPNKQKNDDPNEVKSKKNLKVESGFKKGSDACEPMNKHSHLPESKKPQANKEVKSHINSGISSAQKCFDENHGSRRHVRAAPAPPSTQSVPASRSTVNHNNIRKDASLPPMKHKSASVRTSRDSHMSSACFNANNKTVAFK